MLLVVAEFAKCLLPDSPEKPWACRACKGFWWGVQDTHTHSLSHKSALSSEVRKFQLDTTARRKNHVVFSMKAGLSPKGFGILGSGFRAKHLGIRASGFSTVSRVEGLGRSRVAKGVSPHLGLGVQG